MRLKRPGLWWRRPRKGSSPDAGTVEAQEQQRQDLGLLLRRRREEPVSYTHLTLPTNREE